VFRGCHIRSARSMSAPRAPPVPAPVRAAASVPSGGLRRAHGVQRGVMARCSRSPVTQLAANRADEGYVTVGVDPVFLDTPSWGRRGGSTTRKSHPPYSPEFRQRFVELVQKGRTPEELSRQFEPSAQAIRQLGEADVPLEVFSAVRVMYPVWRGPGTTGSMA